MTAVQGDDEVVAGEVGVRELAGSVTGPVVPVPFQRVERALIRPLTHVPVSRSRARGRDAVADAGGIREPAEDDIRHR